MTVSSEELRLIRNSFDILQADIGPKSIYFYDRLFEHAPHLRAMFRPDDIGGQGMKFMSTLRVIVDNLHSPDTLSERYTNLGKAHAMLGVTAKDFPPMRTALLDTIQETLGDEYSDSIATAWTKAFDEFSSAIIEKGKIPNS